MARLRGKGSKLHVTTNPNAVAQVVSIGIGPDVSTTEVTEIDSNWREFIPTISNGGDVSLEIHYDPKSTTHATLHGLLITPSVTPFVLEYSDGTTYSFSAILTGFDVSGLEVEGVVSASVTLQITGAITITVASA